MCWRKTNELPPKMPIKLPYKRFFAKTLTKTSTKFLSDMLEYLLLTLSHYNTFLLPPSLSLSFSFPFSTQPFYEALPCLDAFFVNGWGARIERTTLKPECLFQRLARVELADVIKYVVRNRRLGDDWVWVGMVLVSKVSNGWVSGLIS